MSAKRSGNSRQPIGFFIGAGTCTSSNCSLYTTNGMLQTGFKPVDTNRCVCKGPNTFINAIKLNYDSRLGVKLLLQNGGGFVCGNQSWEIRTGRPVLKEEEGGGAITYGIGLPEGEFGTVKPVNGRPNCMD
ncbi:hypothetical protein AVEN_27459-1 [Araneus ventricosus]|uniref:Uncharacterized protein n=1 Tax=Araneus ventricosus TaxID=182803 RepID=A0A4Y2R9Y0_ARAVE|nr:hypothetical protein AVEN_27459-1 [Araneus ventricosus]